MINPHQVIVHFPVALLTTGTAFTLANLISRSDRWAGAAWWNVALGTVGAALSALSGYMAEHDALALGVDQKLVALHERMGYITAGYWVAYLVVAAFGFTRLADGSRRTASLALQCIGVGLLVWTGSLGGFIVRAMVYR